MKCIDFVFQPNGQVKDRANKEMRNNIDLSMKAEIHEIESKSGNTHAPQTLHFIILYVHINITS